MAASSTSRTNGNSIIDGSKQYPYPSNVNVTSFVPVKLYGKLNYQSWQEKMKCLMESHDMVGFIDGTLKNPRENNGSEAKYREWKRSDALVRKWIFGSLHDIVVGTDIFLQTANEVWDKLKTNYTAPIDAPTDMEKEGDWGVYVPLCRAIQKGDWMKSLEFLNENRNALTDQINEAQERTLHVAIGNPDNDLVLQYLLDLIDPKLLPNLVNDELENALHYAARLDNTEAAIKLVEKNPDLLFRVDEEKRLPIESAIINSHKNTFNYLFKACKTHISRSQNQYLHNPFEGEHGVLLLDETISSGVFDVAYELLNKYPKLATIKVDNKAPLYSIAKKCDSYPSAKRYNFYQRFVYSHVPVKDYHLDNTYNKQDIENQEIKMTNLVETGVVNYMYQVLETWMYNKFWNVALLRVQHIKRLHDDKVIHNTALTILEFICEEVGKLKSDHNEHYEDAFGVAVENNTPEVLRMISRTFPQSIWTEINCYTLSQLSIINRCENVYNFFVHEVTHDKHLHKTCLDLKGNNLLHLAGRLASTHKLSMVTGAALQMQRELQWFREVEKIMRPREREHKNDDKETPYMVFRKEHEDLRQKGESWMKKTADSYTITAALIITIVFAAAITIPGGNKEDTGKPNFESRPSFFIFVISDAISFFTSTTSLLLFLSILTARYAEEDFLKKLPKRLILGLVMLFMSVTTMVIAFSATLYIMFGQGKLWILIPVVVFTCLPVASFLALQLPLLYDLISSTYGRGIFLKRSDLSVNNSLHNYKPKPKSKPIVLKS